MGPAVVVIVRPFLCFLPVRIERPEDVGIEEFTSEAAVHVLDIRVLGGLLRLNEGKRDPAVFAPRVEAPADKLRAVIHVDHGGKAAAFFKLIRPAERTTTPRAVVDVV
jgi:hypothetical protein